MVKNNFHCSKDTNPIHGNIFTIDSQIQKCKRARKDQKWPERTRKGQKRPERTRKDYI